MGFGPHRNTTFNSAGASFPYRRRCGQELSSSSGILPPLLPCLLDVTNAGAKSAGLTILLQQSSNQSWLKKSLLGSRGVSYTWAERFTRAGLAEIKSQLSFPNNIVSASLEIQPFVPFYCLLVVLQGRTDVGSFAYSNSPKLGVVVPQSTPPQADQLQNPQSEGATLTFSAAVLRCTPLRDPHTTS